MVWKRLKQNAARFLRDRSGNVAMIFALTLVPIAVLSGGAVDFNQAMNARTRLAQALDSAALAAGAEITADDQAASIIARDFIQANYPSREIGVVQNIAARIDDEADTVTVTGSARVETSFLGLIGINYITVNWESEVQRARQRLELVMVLDNTGSMSGSKIRSLRDAAELLTDILFDAAEEAGDVRIGLVPFAATVNVGTQYARDWWLDPDARSPVHAEWAGGEQEVETCTGRGRRRTCTTETVTPNNWDFFDQLRNTSWEGCVEARPLPYDIDDTPPSNGDPATLFVPYFAPDEPDYGNFRNDYLDDDLRNAGVIERFENLSRFDGGRPNGGSPNRSCTTTPILPLSDNQRSIEDAIGDMGASGNTNIPQGVGWGIRVLSPGLPFTEGVAWDDDDVIKAMVILTDGDNVMSGRNTYMQSEYEGYGYSRYGRLGVSSASSNRLSDALDDRLVAACDEARDLGIRVYSITFQVRNSTTRALMRDCASHPTLYFDSPSDEALEDAFEQIASDLANLRISR